MICCPRSCRQDLRAAFKSMTDETSSMYLEYSARRDPTLTGEVAGDAEWSHICTANAERMNNFGMAIRCMPDFFFQWGVVQGGSCSRGCCARVASLQGCCRARGVPCKGVAVQGSACCEGCTTRGNVAHRVKGGGDISQYFGNSQEVMRPSVESREYISSR